jgi:hypothetical protein
MAFHKVLYAYPYGQFQSIVGNVNFGERATATYVDRVDERQVSFVYSAKDHAGNSQ